MILSVSRRTDIPNYYSEWFYNRIKEGFVYVRNPMNVHQVSKVALSPDLVDCIAFWTKNPKPMMGRLDELSAYKYYFQFTLTGYGKDIEHNCCIDKALIEKIIGCKLNVRKDKNQRSECGCMESVEIGTYNTCKNDCKYCYANWSPESVRRNCYNYDENSPLLCGSLSEDDVITERKVKSCKEVQLNLFE